MLTGNKTIFFFLILAFGISDVIGQNADSISSKPFERYWTKPRLVPKLGLGMQGNAFLELGIQYHKIYVHPFTLASSGPYLTSDLFVYENTAILGPKIGYELTVGLLGLATDVAYYSDFDRESVLLTPKVGISLLGFADLFYGRSFTLSDDSFESMSVSRFSLLVNLNRDYFDLRDARRKK